MLQEEREQIQKILRELMVLREDLNELEKTFSRLGNETVELYKKLDGMLDEH